MARKGLYANINARKRKGISRPKSKSTISKKAYANMKAGFPKKRKPKKQPKRGTNMANREPKKLTEQQKKRLKDPKILMALKAMKSSKKRTQRR